MSKKKIQTSFVSQEIYRYWHATCYENDIYIYFDGEIRPNNTWMKKTRNKKIK